MNHSQQMEEYYKKFINLQEKLQKSEEERLKLEIKFNDMIQISREEEQIYYRRLKHRYKQFLVEDKERQIRNEKLIELLERVELRAATLEAKTERFQTIRRHFNSYLNDAPTRKPTMQTFDDLSMRKSIIDEENLHHKYLNRINKQCGSASSTAAENILNAIRPMHDYNSNSLYTNNNHGYDYKPTETKKPLYSFTEELKASKPIAQPEFVQNYGDTIKDNILKKIEENKLSTADSIIENYRRVAADNYDSNAMDYDYKNPTENCDFKVLEKSPIVTADVPFTINNGKLGLETHTNDPLSLRASPNLDLDTNVQSNGYNGDDEFGFVSNKVEINKSKISEVNKATLPTNDDLALLKTADIEVVTSYNKEATDEINELKDIDTLNIDLMNDKKTTLIDKDSNICETNTTVAADSSINKNVEATKLYLQSQRDNVQTNNVTSKNQNIIGSGPEINSSGQFDKNGKPLQYDAKEQLKQYDKHEQPVSFDATEQPLQYDANTIRIQPIKAEDTVQFDANATLQLEKIGNQSIQNTKTVADEIQYDANAQPIQYDEKGQPIQYDENGQPIQYDENGQPIQYDENGLPIQYDEQGQPIPYVANDHAVQYDANGQPIQYDEQGQPIQYDEQGQPVQYDKLGQPIQYDEQGQQIQYDANGQPIQYDETGQPIQYDESGQPIQYDANGQPIQYDANGQPIQYDANSQPIQYDENGQPIQYETSGQPIQYDENGQPIQYDENGQPIQYDANGQPIQYDANSQPIQYDENGQPIQYDENGQPIQYDTSGQPIQYDENGQPIQYDANGQPIQYDANGQPIQYDETGQLIQYDENGQPIQYDANGQPIQYNANGQSIQYDANGQPVQYDESVQPIQHDENGQPIQFDEKEQPIKYDVNGQPIQYDEQGQPIQYDEQGQPIQYDEQGQPIQYDNKQSDASVHLNDPEAIDKLESDPTVSAEFKEKQAIEDDKKATNVFEMLDTETDSLKDDTNKITNDSDFDMSSH